MIFFKLIAKKTHIPLLFFLFIQLSAKAQEGQQLFASNCASCHAIDRQLSAPALRDVETRGPWTDRANLHKWMRNPGAFIPTTEYTRNLQQQYGQIMPSFTTSQLSNEQIDAIFDYIASVPPPGSGGGAGAPVVGAEETGNQGLLFGIISIVLAIIALILMQVNSNLKKLSDDKEQILRPEPVPFYRNKVYIALFAVILFMGGGYFVAKSAIGLGRQQGYQPDQPIYFSHKVHAGLNQINCLYCHGGAAEGKHAGIPTLNICMNCHNVINTYEKGPKLFDDEGNEISGTGEIQKLYKYANFTPGPNAKWNPAGARSPEWVKIHNLQDHVYFNHAQHVRVGQVACQTCHGNIQEMDKVSQQSELSMGWCINCHRETKINFNYNDSAGNKFYSIYEKFHNDFAAGKMDSLKVQDIGGLECQKCHY